MAAGQHIAKEEVLVGNRAGLHGLIRSNPGIEFTALASRTGLAFGVLQYHLDVLTRRGLVASEKSGRYRRFYVVGAVPLVTRPGHAMAINPVVARLLRILAKSPGSTQPQLAAAMGKSRQGCGYHLARAIQNRLVRVEHRGGPGAYYAESDAKADVRARPMTGNGGTSIVVLAPDMQATNAGPLKRFAGRTCSMTKTRTSATTSCAPSSSAVPNSTLSGHSLGAGAPAAISTTD